MRRDVLRESVNLLCYPVDKTSDTCIYTRCSSSRTAESKTDHAFQLPDAVTLAISKFEESLDKNLCHHLRNLRTA
ncbi:hypothetical protein T03_3460 [Trichinella britovi]|uniref:Uncharacterized protein n=1 Tax=Trichinella britovi TaxID=45882 RepID=A0A0V1CKD2_TRIBR|nr:hypothetical protein T09_9336 [Trichinella sp. T9]KRY49452.1 hypothetical protein T03_3460 [Trichinella britovi]KRZ93667.1 hypothetical protein T08_9458 [Trichinella sp. T8]